MAKDSVLAEPAQAEPARPAGGVPAPARTGAPPPAAGRRRTALLARPAVLRWVFSCLLAAAIWEATARLFVTDTLFFVPLSTVFARGAELWATGELGTHIWVSFLEFAWGFALSALAGIGFGIVMAESRTVRGLLDPWVSMLYATPVIALGPLFILWLGIGIASKIAIVFLTAVFPILINTVSGLTTTDRTLLEVARSYGASSLQIYHKVRLPAALPFIIAGLRVSVARALVGVVVAELFGARAGLGFMIVNAAQAFDTAGLFVGVLLFAVAGVLSVEALKWLEARLAPWRSQDNEAA